MDNTVPDNSSEDQDTQSSAEVEKSEKSEGEAKVGESSSDSSIPATISPPDTKKKQKINILLKPVGDAPILKQKLWAVDPDKPVSSIQIFVKSYLRLEKDQSLFFFVNQAFAPSPDQLIRNLYECFGSDGKLILNYSTTTAWG